MSIKPGDIVHAIIGMYEPKDTDPRVRVLVERISPDYDGFPYFYVMYLDAFKDHEVDIKQYEKERIPGNFIEEIQLTIKENEVTFKKNDRVMARLYNEGEFVPGTLLDELDKDGEYFVDFDGGGSSYVDASNVKAIEVVTPNDTSAEYVIKKDGNIYATYTDERTAKAYVKGFIDAGGSGLEVFKTYTRTEKVDL